MFNIYVDQNILSNTVSTVLVNSVEVDPLTIFLHIGINPEVKVPFLQPANNIASEVVREEVYPFNRIGNLQNLYIVSEKAGINKRVTVNHDLLKIDCDTEERPNKGTFDDSYR